MQNVKLSVKLIGSFIIVAGITLVVGFFGWRGVNRLSGHLEEVGGVRLPGIQSLLIIEKEAETFRVAQQTLLNPNLPREDKVRQFENIALLRERYEKAWKIYEPLPQTPEEAKLWREFVPAWEEWRKENGVFLKIVEELNSLDVGNPMALLGTLEKIRGDHHQLMAKVSRLFSDDRLFSGGEDHTGCLFGRWAASFQSQNPSIRNAVAGMLESHRQFHEAVAKIKTQIEEGDSAAAETTFDREMAPAAEKVFAGLDTLLEISNKAEALYNQANQQAMVTAFEKQKAALQYLDKIIEINLNVANEAKRTADSESADSKLLSAVSIAAGFFAALAFGIFLSISITRKLNAIIEGLNDGAEQVSSAASQISGASQSLAEGASEQAASIEETSSSLEEMSSMTRQNADNANQADSLMKQTNQVVNAANRSMDELTRSMKEISKASEETSKIIKTIDEIAFQTNLLALNAAVEAARAGEAGAGFAVVADEVRNLAMRAADAAKNTADLIQGTVKQVKAGGELVAKTNGNFTEVANSSARVGELVAEIAAASIEQAQGISEVNTAVSEVDKVTQQNAANAEESASASEEMSAQAEQMNAFVAELAALVGSSKNGHRSNGSRDKGAEKVRTPSNSHPSARFSLRLGGNGKGSEKKRINGKTRPEMPAGAIQQATPEQMIPLDENPENF